MTKNETPEIVIDPFLNKLTRSVRKTVNSPVVKHIIVPIAIAATVRIGTQILVGKYEDHLEAKSEASTTED
jgi:hypothetical protein